ncbi:MAG: MarR family transcriptional regulator [Myxococcota bacterium]
MRPTPPEGKSAPRSSAPRKGIESDASRVRVRYQDNLARHLIGLARDLQNRVMTHLTVERGYGDLRLSLGPMLSLIRLAPRSASALASALAITPQACSQMVKYAAGAGYVQQTTSEGDRRAKVIRLTDRGEQLVIDASEIILSVDAEYRSQAGPRAYQRFTTCLAELFAALPIPIRSDAEIKISAQGTAAVLPMISMQIQQDLMTDTISKGHPGLKMSHGQILPLIGPEGARVHQIARIHRVSRQAVSTTARDLESLGYLAGETDPRDGRGIVLRLTERGETLIKDSVGAVDALEDQFLEVLGQRRLAQLQTIARKLYLSLHLESEIFESDETRARAGSTQNSILLPSDLRERLRRTAVREPKAGASRSPDLERLAAELRSHLGPKSSAQLASLLLHDVASDRNKQPSKPKSIRTHSERKR